MKNRVLHVDLDRHLRVAHAVRLAEPARSRCAWQGRARAYLDLPNLACAAAVVGVLP